MILAETDVILSDWRFRIYPIGDMHMTLRTFDEKRLKKYIKTIQEDPAAVAILMGDVSDARSREHKYFSGEMIHPRYRIEDIDILEDKAADEAAEILAPLGDKLAVILRGNHHQAGFTHSLRRELRYLTGHAPADAGDRGMLRIRTHAPNRPTKCEGTYVVFAQHKTSVAASPGAKKNMQVKIVKSFDADLYLFAHAHSGDEHRQVHYRMRRSGKLALERRDRTFISANAWLEPIATGSNSYADEKGLLPQDDTVWFADVRLTTSGGTMTTRRVIWEG